MLLFDSLTRNKKKFVPLKNKEVKLYVCGITPDNATHLGHAFVYVFFDAFIRYLKHKEYNVTYVQNATDINDSDDVLRQATETGKSWKEIAQYWIGHFHKQMDALNVGRPTHYILASSVIDKIVEINTALIKKGLAYEKMGNVYFDVRTFKEYGALSRLNPEAMVIISKERGNDPDDPNKRNPLDFVLWISPNTTGSVKNPDTDPVWKSPWGRGRPGWHIECSAMIHQYLGEQIDIHGGGHDLIYPHHESEIAQSESYIGKKPFVNYWMHNGMVLYEGEKMSKSLGNLVLVDDVIAKCSPDALRWLLLSHHYRQPWEFEYCDLHEASYRMQETKSKIHKKDAGDFKKIEAFLEDDMNTPAVLLYLAEFCSGATLKKGLDLFGLSTV